MRFLALAAALTLPVAALAASGNDWNPPKPTETTKTCKGKRVWDEQKKRCVRPRKSSLNQEQLLGAARELAYAGRQEDAQAVLSVMADQQDSVVLTYWGFTHRKLGNSELARAYYDQALARDFWAELLKSIGSRYSSKPSTQNQPITIDVFI